jgi:hypothetical protein
MCVKKLQKFGGFALLGYKILRLGAADIGQS